MNKHGRLRKLLFSIFLAILLDEYLSIFVSPAKQTCEPGWCHRSRVAAKEPSFVRVRLSLLPRALSVKTTHLHAISGKSHATYDRSYRKIKDTLTLIIWLPLYPHSD